MHVPGPGRPSEYRVEFCERVVELGREGKSVAQIAADLGYCKQTIYTWKDKHPEFAEAMAFAMTLSQAWWEGKAQDNLATPGFNATLWAKNVNCRFSDDYAERQKHEVSGPNGGPIQNITRIERVIVDPHPDR